MRPKQTKPDKGKAFVKEKRPAKRKIGEFSFKRESDGKVTLKKV